MKPVKQILENQHDYFKKTVRWAWILLIFILIFTPAFIYSVSVDLFGLYGPMPSMVMLENPENDLSSEIITSDGVSMGRYYRYNRSQVNFEDLSTELVNTLIASEDIRFYSHSGLDLRAYLRVIKGILTFNLQGGGSTITQQLAKNLYTQNQEFGLDGTLSKLGGPPKRVIQKIKEWIISVHLERNFTKEEILSMYLNTADFSSNSFGIKVASETYFSKTPDSLNYIESAILVGMLQATTTFNPKLNPENSFNKRNKVIGQLLKYDYITEELHDSLIQVPIDMSNYRVESHNTGMATHFRSLLRTELMVWAKENNYDLFDDGLKIYITLDSRMQQYAEDAVTQHMTSLQDDFFKVWKGKNPWRDDKGKEIPGFLEKRYKATQSYKSLVNKYGEDSDSLKIMMNLPRQMKVFSWHGDIDTLLSPLDSMKYYKHFLQTGFMAMDPHSGQIKAWVGGIDHRYFQFDHVKQGKRQPGSTFKTFVYGLAMLENYKPCEEMVDDSPTFNDNGKLWRPENAEGGYGKGERMTLRQAMARSVNSITAQMMKKLTAENVVKFAHQVGIESDLLAVPSLCLGTSDVSVYELVGAYSTFVNKGIHIKPYYVNKIEDKFGNIIYNAVPDMEERIDEQTAYKVLYMLRGGVEEADGTSRGISRFVKENNEVGGKTGTTNNASDGWYMGVTKDLVAGGWVGGEERTIHFKTWFDGQGGKTARPIWDLFMQKVYADKELGITKGPFPRPLSGIDIVLDCEKYNIVDSAAVQQQHPWNPDEIE